MSGGALGKRNASDMLGESNLAHLSDVLLIHLVRWQKLRTAEVSFDKEMTEGILLKLTTREREIRKRIEDILYPQTSQTVQSPRLNGRSS